MQLLNSQVRNLRKRQLVEEFTAGRRAGTYWGIRSDISHYGLQGARDCPYASTLALAKVPTRLAALAPEVQERLINWGYAVCDAAMRRWVEPGAAPPAGFPYPAADVGLHLHQVG